MVEFCKQTSPQTIGKSGEKRNICRRVAPRAVAADCHKERFDVYGREVSDRMNADINWKS